MNRQFIVNEFYQLIFSRGGDYVMQDITRIEDHQYQTITSDDKSNKCTLPSFIFSRALLKAEPGYRQAIANATI